MKIGVLGDLHLRVRPPRARTENDFTTVGLGKLENAIDICHDAACEAIIQVGDFFDSPNPSGELVAKTIETILSTSCIHPPIWAIHGQHDMAYHTEASMRSSTLRILNAAECIGLLNSEPVVINDDNTQCSIYGASFGQQPVKSSTAGINILVAHAMVGDKPLWPGHKLTGPAEYAKQHPGYDLYLLGDYHYRWEEKKDGWLALNPGCVQRLTMRDKDHIPKVAIIDLDSMNVEWKTIPHQPVEEVFRGEIEDDSIPKETFSELVRIMKHRKDVGVNFADNLVSFFESRDTPQAIQDIIWSVLKEAENG